jgi:hypothetical protein
MELLHVHLLQAQDANAFQKCNIQYGYIEWHQGGFKSPPNVIIEEWGFEILRVQPALLVQIGGARACTSKLMCLVQLQHKDCDADPFKCIKAVPNNQKLLHSDYRVQ